MRTAIGAVILATCCIAQTPGDPRPSIRQQSNGTNSPNINIHRGTATVNYGVDPKAFLEVTKRFVKALEDRKALEKELKSVQEQLDTQRDLSESRAAKLRETVAVKDNELKIKTALADSLANELLRIHDALRRSEVERNKIGRRANALSLSARVGSEQVDADEHRRALALSILAIDTDFSAETASTATAELLRLSGPPIGNLGFVAPNLTGTRIIGATEENGLFLWETATGRLLKEEWSGVARHRTMGISAPPLSDSLFTFGDHGEIRIWSRTTLDLLRTWTVPAVQPNDFWTHALSHNGAILLEGNYSTLTTLRTLNVWDTATGKKLNTLPHSSANTLLAISNEGDIIVTSERINNSSKVTIWKPGRQEPLTTYTTSHIEDINSGTRGRVFGLTRGKNGREIWELRSRKRVHMAVDITDRGAAQLYLSSGDRLVVHNETSLKLIDIWSMKPLFEAPPDVDGIAIDKLSKAAMIGVDGSAILVDLSTNEMHRLHSKSYMGGSFAVPANLFVGQSMSGLVAWRIADKTPVWDRTMAFAAAAVPLVARRSAVGRLSRLYREFLDISSTKDHSYSSGTFTFSDTWKLELERHNELTSEKPYLEQLSYNGKFLARCFTAGGCVVTNRSSGTEIARFAEPARKMRGQTFVSDDGKAMVVAGDREVNRWDIGASHPMNVFALQDDFDSITTNADLRFAAIGYPNGCVEIADITGRKRKAIGDCSSRVTDLDLSDNGDILAVGRREGTTQIWDVPSNTLLASFRLPNAVSSVVLAPNGMFIAAGSDPTSGGTRGLVKVWNLQANRPTLEFSVFGQVSGLGFSEASDTLVVANPNHALAVPVTKQSLTEALCKLTVSDRSQNKSVEPMTTASNYCFTLGLR